ncbi:hypothetical protein C3747_102g59 [Trypanosoma cruzi]|uniref:Uncharacterized protein n=1 Tax=Trypanosoma cruzi TaxID=5693 RepID=A0A2V2WGH7_TRYCR|nr:hypothetical protein C3747_102g59 [Trypanosoma cruzi]
MMTEMMRQPDLYVNLEGDALVRHLNLLFWSVSLAEVEPLFIRPAVNALLIVVEKYGNRVKDISTPFLLPWRVMLVSGMRRVIQSSVFCCEESCLLAESFINCNLADDNSVRRVVLALMTLLETLERCDADYEAIVHGGCGVLSWRFRLAAHGGSGRLVAGRRGCIGGPCVIEWAGGCGFNKQPVGGIHGNGARI